MKKHSRRALKTHYFASMKLFLGLFFCLLYNTVNANAIYVGAGTQVFSFFKPNIYVKHFTVKGELDSIQLFDAYDHNKFKLLDRNIFNAGLTSNYHYLSVQIINNNEKSGLIYWVIKNSAVNELKLYSRSNGSINSYKEFGDHFNFSSRPDNFFLFGIPLETKGKSKTDFILRLDKRNENLFLPFNFYYPKEYQKFKNNMYLIFGCFSGVLIVMALINVFLYFSFKDEIHIYYVVYVISNLFIILSFEGIDFELFYPNSPFISDISRYLTTSIELISSILLYRKFVGINAFSCSSLIQLLLTITLILLVLLIPSSYFVFNDISNLYISKSLFLKLFSLINFITMGLIIISSVQKFRAGYKPALFFVIAVGLIYIGGVEYLLNTNGVITDNLLFKNIIPNTLVYGIMAEVIIVCMGIVYRYNSFKRERDDYRNLIIEKQNELNNASIIYKEKERNRIADNIHDEIASRIFGIRMLTEAIKNNLGQKEIETQLNQLSSSLDIVDQKTRAVIIELSDLNTKNISSLIKSIIDLISEMSNNSNRLIYFEGFDEKDSFQLPQLKCDQLLLVFREIFTNFHRHSKSNELRVLFEIDSSLFQFTLTENPIKKNPLPFKNGNGINSIIKRVESIDGIIYWEFNESLNIFLSISYN